MIGKRVSFRIIRKFLSSYYCYPVGELVAIEVFRLPSEYFTTYAVE